MKTVTTSQLLTFSALSAVPEAQLQWLIDNSSEQVLSEGEYLLKEGQIIDTTHVVISGELIVYIIQNGERRELSLMSTGTVTGYLPYSRAKISPVDCIALGPVHLLSLPADFMMPMIAQHFELTQAMVHVMSTRVRFNTALQEQNEKTTALGKLSAGLAHELNNPASAIVRDAASLITHLQFNPENFKKIIDIKMTETETDAVAQTLARFSQAETPGRTSLSAKNNLEDQISALLDEHEIAESLDLAGTFADLSFSLEDFKILVSHIPDGHKSTVLNWISRMMLSEDLLKSIMISSKRIADLVNTVKLFTNMDRGGDRQTTDIHLGLDNTLAMLNHKLANENIAVIREFDQTLPHIHAWPAELNQIWINIIDNAIDAMKNVSARKLTIKTSHEKECVLIAISDTGLGIKEAILPKIFDPFFTTKPVGEGIGMGLHIAQRIASHHQGTITVESTAGHTRFCIRLKI